MKIEIEKEVSYDVPEGKYCAGLSEVVEQVHPNTGEVESVRFRWDILSPEDDQYDYKAGKPYHFTSGQSAVLKADLKRWLGKTLHTLKDENGVLDLQILVGRKADIIITHVNNPKYNKPYVCVKEVYPQGTLVD